MNRELKRLAKQALSGKQGIAAALFILPLAVTVFISLLESLLSLVTGYPLLSETAGDIRGLLGISPWTVAISLGGALAGFVLLVPLDIGIKRWYFRIFESVGPRQEPVEAAEETTAPKSEPAANDGDTIVFEPLRTESRPHEDAPELPEGGFSIDELFSSGRRTEAESEAASDTAPEAAEVPGAIEAAAAVETVETAETAPEPAQTEKNAEERSARFDHSLGSAFDLFAGARDYFGALWLRVVISLRSLGWLILFSLPGTALFGVQMWLLGAFEGGLAFEGMETLMNEKSLVLIPSVLLIIMSWVVCGVFLLRYSAAEYIWADARGTGRIGVRGAIKQSVRAMRGNRLRLVGGAFSFAGWWLLCLFLIPAMYVVPYFCAYKAAFVRRALESAE